MDSTVQTKMPGTTSLCELQNDRVTQGVYMCVSESRKAESSGYCVENILESLQGMDLLEERNSDTSHPGTRLLEEMAAI